jgi:hypothetical protein
MRAIAIIPVCLVAILLCSCGSGATTNCKAPPDRALLLAVRAHAAQIKPGSGTSSNAGRLTITACQTSDSEATATMTIFSLKDPRTRDIRHGMTLKRKGTNWVITKDAHTRRCQKGPGSEEFSSAKCTG